MSTPLENSPYGDHDDGAEFGYEDWLEEDGPGFMDTGGDEGGTNLGEDHRDTLMSDNAYDVTTVSEDGLLGPGSQEIADVDDRVVAFLTLPLTSLNERLVDLQVAQGNCASIAFNKAMNGSLPDGDTIKEIERLFPIVKSLEALRQLRVTYDDCLANGSPEPDELEQMETEMGKILQTRELLEELLPQLQQSPTAADGVAEYFINYRRDLAHRQALAKTVVEKGLHVHEAESRKYIFLYKLPSDTKNRIDSTKNMSLQPELAKIAQTISSKDPKTNYDFGMNDNCHGIYSYYSLLTTVFHSKAWSSLLKKIHEASVSGIMFKMRLDIRTGCRELIEDYLI